MDEKEEVTYYVTYSWRAIRITHQVNKKEEVTYHVDLQLEGHEERSLDGEKRAGELLYST